jgi:hypothetical protein
MAHDSGRSSGATYVGNVRVETFHSTTLSNATAPPRKPGTPSPWLYGFGILFLAPLMTQMTIFAVAGFLKALTLHLPHSNAHHVVGHAAAQASIWPILLGLLNLAVLAGFVTLGIVLYRRNKAAADQIRRFEYEPKLRAWLRSYVCRNCGFHFQI